jgi:hypothetical protein
MALPRRSVASLNRLCRRLGGDGSAAPFGCFFESAVPPAVMAMALPRRSVASLNQRSAGLRRLASIKIRTQSQFCCV